MRVVYSWLREFCDPGIPVEDAAETLTRLGFEVAAIHRPWDGVSGVTVARVLEVRDHPRSDKLTVARLRTASGDAQVVAGVRNFSAGDLVPYAPPGSRVAALPEALSTRELRGERSEGMICSPHELAISADHSGILLLGEEAPVGADLKSWLGLDGDAVLELELEPNRPDMLSVVGVARELSAGTGAPFLYPAVDPTPPGQEAADVAGLDVRDPERCPHYQARVIRGVTFGRSPPAVQARLFASGMRPLGNVIDATNYVMLELGQPLHPFDLELLEGKTVIVRRAMEGERMVTLDGMERILRSDDLLIADARRGVGVAGVMGSAVAEVSPNTRDVLLESAHFEPSGILRTARRLGLRTEASVRFERGVDPEAVTPAATRAGHLLARWSGGVMLGGALEVGGPPPRRSVAIRASRAALVLGDPVTAGDVTQALRALHLQPAEAPSRDDSPQFVIPGYRPDLRREIDLIEEVGRLRGYERIPSILPGARQVGGLTREQLVRGRVREIMTGAGLYEVKSNSFLSEADLAIYDGAAPPAIRVANPLSEEAPYVRVSMLPGLVAALARNVAYGASFVRLFEIGKVAVAGPDGPVEQERVTAILAGQPETIWLGREGQVDFYDAKGVLEVLLEGLGVRGWAPGEALGSPFHPARSAAVVLDGQPAGSVGELHPSLALERGRFERIAIVDVSLTALAEAAAMQLQYRTVSRFPPVRRDLAFELDAPIPAADVEATIRAAAGRDLESCRLFDVFQGDPLPPGRRSLAFAVAFRSPDRTLTDAEADELVGAIAVRVRDRLGGDLRAGSGLPSEP